MAGDGELDEEGWIDLRARLAGSDLPEDLVDQLIEALTGRLVGHFGVDTIDCWLGKDGTSRHSMSEVAAAAIAHLASTIDPEAAASLESLAPPWDSSWRNNPRTASWRS